MSKKVRGGKEFVGKVVGASMAKTVTVAVTHLYRHPLYKKAVRRSKLFLAHNESLPVAIGDTVLITETKPVSKRKHFMVKEKVSA